MTEWQTEIQTRIHDHRGFYRDFGRVPWFSVIAVILRQGCENQHTVIQHLNGRWCIPVHESRAVAQKPHDAFVKFNTVPI